MSPVSVALLVVLTAGEIDQPVSETGRAIRDSREVVTRVLRESNRAQGRDPSQTAPRLLEVYRQLSLADQLPATERRRLQSQLRVRLLEQQDIFRRRVARAASSNTGGSPVAARAQELIDLIQSTVEPDSWAVNGGRGTIFFYSPLNVLVVRQTGEVHSQLGGALNQLRR